MGTHDSLLQKATETKLRLEAEGMTETAAALDQVISTYAKDHLKDLTLQNEPKIPKVYIMVYAELTNSPQRY